ncbi:MAG: ABC transporter ATP-binding protein [Methanoculleaceae archaeon]
MIRIRDLRYRYPGGDKDTLRGIDLNVSPGECVVVTGPTGAGKTTLCMAAAGITVHELGGLQQGSVMINGREISDYSSITEIGGQVSVVFDDPESQLIFTTVEEEIRSALEQRGCAPGNPEERLEEILQMTGLSPLRHRPPHTLSGGQKQLVAFTAAIASGTQALILDEPTSELDDGTTETVLSILRDLKGRGTAILCVEHKVNRMAELADRCYRLEGGRLNPLFTGCDRDGTSGYRMPVHGRNMSRTTPIIRAEGLVHRYGDVVALAGIDLEIYPGECVAIVGRNGSGKTTLIKHFNGLLQPTAGSISVAGKIPAIEGVSSMARYVGIVFQNPDKMLFADTVREEVAFGVDNLGLPGRDDAISTALAKLGLESMGERYPRTLSRGERQRLAIASVLAMDTDILVLDEPTTGLDPVESERVLEILAGLQRAGKTVIMVTHSMDLVTAAASRVIQMDCGRIVGDTGRMET